MSKDKTFEKFKLVPYNESPKTGKCSSKTGTIVKPAMLEKAKTYVRDYDPTLHAKTNAYVGMRQALFGRKPGWTARKRLDLLSSNMARYKHLASTAPLPENEQIQHEQIQHETPKVREDSDYIDVKPQHDDLEEKVQPGYEFKPLLAIPKNRYGDFENLRSLSSNTIKAGKHGEIVIRGTTVPGSSYSDVMRAIYISPKRGKALPVGLAEVVSELKRLDAPSTLLFAKRAQALYAKAVTPTQTGSGRTKPRQLKTFATAKSMKKSPKILRLY